MTRERIFIIDLLISIIFFSYFGYIFMLTTSNIPINDDYGILNNFNHIINSNSISEKIKLFYNQHNEHRLLYDKTCFFLDYKIFNQINFNHLSIIGNLSLVGIFILLYKKFERLKKRIFILIPLSTIIFNISFHENITFAMASLSNFTVILFTLLSIHFITKEQINNKNFILSTLFLIFSVFTQGSGLFLILIILLVLLYKNEKKYLLFFTVISFLIVGLYFINYEKPINSPDIFETIKTQKLTAIIFSFSFLGNIFAKNLIFTNDLNESLMISTAAGTIFFLIYIYLIKIKFYKKSLFIFSVMSFILLVSFVTGLTRAQLGIETSISSRYRLNSAVFLICILYFLIDKYVYNKNINFNFINLLILFFSTIYFYGFSYPQNEYLEFRKTQNYFGLLNYYNGNHKLLNGFEQDFYNEVLIESKISETYFLPKQSEINNEYKVSELVKLNENNISSKPATGNIDKIIKLQNSTYIEGWAFVEDENTKKQEIILAVEDTISNRKIYFKGKKIKRFDLNPYFKKNNLEECGCVFIVKNEYVKDIYKKIYLVVSIEKQNYIYNSLKKLQ